METPHIKTVAKKGKDMDFLKDVLGDELYGSVETKLNEYNAANKGKEIKLANLSAGGYVSIDKYNTAQTELAGVKEQLQEANKTLKSYKDMDIEGIKQSAANWEAKYNTDTAALQEKIATQQKEFAAKEYLSGKGFKSKLAQKAALSGMMELEYKDGTFSGAEEYLKKLKEEDPDSFMPDEQERQKNKPQNWVRGTGRTLNNPKTASEEEAYLKAKYGNNKYYRGGSK